MRELIAEFLCKKCEKETHDNLEICNEPTRGVDKPCDYAVEYAGQICKLVTQEIKKVEKTNPYSMKTTEGLAWWQGCQKILNLLEGK